MGIIYSDRYIDAEFKRILDYLEESGLKKNTLVIIVGDHGEAFGENPLGDFNPDNPGQLNFGHQQSHFDPEIRVPLIIYNPKARQKGQRLPALSQTIDIVPTILEIMNIPKPDYIEGKSLLPMMRGLQQSVNPHILAILRIPENKKEDILKIKACIRTTEWKFVKIKDSRNKQKHIVQALFDLTQNKEIDVSERHPEMTRVFAEEMDLILRHVQTSLNGQDPDVPLSEEEKEILRSLGYIR